jgi:hypothetical protein
VVAGETDWVILIGGGEGRLCGRGHEDGGRVEGAVVEVNSFDGADGHLVVGEPDVLGAVNPG